MTERALDEKTGEQLWEHRYPSQFKPKFYDGGTSGTPTVEGDTSYLWRHFSRDSNFGVAVSDQAMYISGHFCKIDAGPGPTETMTERLPFQCSGDPVHGIVSCERPSPAQNAATWLASAAASCRKP